MRRVVARYDDEGDAADAEADLRQAGLDPERPDIENPFFDPSARPPEARGLLWGGLVGGVVGAAILLAMAVDVLWVPRLSPIMSAGRLALVTFGFGLGAAVGGFVGGIWGTLGELSDPEGPRVAVRVSDAEVGDVKERLRTHDAVVVDDGATSYETR
ncbi:hypothetical protein [Candidatus Halobonum tyrrellensis]|uniref:DUF1269 domain-containing protein n=1 Tax=Candidatus Halobonum tyrrellensis G22 TaxID=1324957 RepID=V4HPK1_9EURY|nr:hypothetical protein [Candidatus Halobonum tyrrellensis]ESP89819.1 hypothetical protein K933_02511 [Candidatus Halobonum tyrrellensis G22]